MTPIIDIVFLLMIFFLVVARFIEAENFPVAVPDKCEFADEQRPHRSQVTTVTVTKGEGGGEFAVGAEKIDAEGAAEIVEQIAGLLDVRLKDLPAEQRVVTLRVDKEVRFAQAQYALAGIAASSAKDIKLAAIKGERP